MAYSGEEQAALHEGIAWNGRPSPSPRLAVTRAEPRRLRRGTSRVRVAQLCDARRMPGGGVNIAHEHCSVILAARGRPRRNPLPCQGQPAVERTYRELALDAGASRGARATRRVRGERVASLMVVRLRSTPRCSHACRRRGLLPALLGVRPSPSRHAFRSARPVLVTTDLLYRRKVASIRSELSDLRHVLILRTPGAGELPPDTLDFEQMMRDTSPHPKPADGRRDMRCCISRAAPPACPKACCTHTRRWLHTSSRRAGARPAGWRRLLVHRRPGLVTASLMG